MGIWRLCWSAGWQHLGSAAGVVISTCFLVLRLATNPANSNSEKNVSWSASLGPAARGTGGPRQYGPIRNECRMTLTLPDSLPDTAFGDDQHGDCEYH